MRAFLGRGFSVVDGGLLVVVEEVDIELKVIVWIIPGLEVDVFLENKFVIPFSFCPSNVSGHCSSLHDLLSLFLVLQAFLSFPNFTDEYLILICEPFPQDLEHWLHGPNSDQLQFSSCHPSTSLSSSFLTCLGFSLASWLILVVSSKLLV